MGLELRITQILRNFLHQVAIPRGGLGTEPQEWRVIEYTVVAIPRGGLGTGISQTSPMFLPSSPSHAVGLEQEGRHESESGRPRSPSHAVGLELYLLNLVIVLKNMSPSHAVGLELKEGEGRKEG